MQRPLMDPLFVKPFVTPKKQWVVTVWTVAALKWFVRTLVSRPLALYKPGQQARAFKFMPEVIRPAAMQALFLPLALSLTAALLVYVGTHPTPPPIMLDPSSQGVYYEQVSMTSEDGTPLMGWMVPALDASRVLAQRDKILHTKYPAIVLVHDFGQTPQQMLPLVGPLHEEGLSVLIVGLRGTGTGKSAGQTFGFNEASDICTAVNFMRSQPKIDDTHIGVLGLGTGATATLIASQRDAGIRVLILADPVNDVDSVVARRIGPRGAMITWMRPFSRWGFQLAYHVTGDDLNYNRLDFLTRTHPSLTLPHGCDHVDYFDRQRIAQIQWFLHKELRTGDATVASGLN